MSNILKCESPPERSLLLVINFLRGGGAERQMSQLARFWSEKGHRVTVATFTSPETARDFYHLPDTVARIHLGTSLRISSLPTAVTKLTKVIRDVRPHKILSFSEACNVVTWIASRLMRQSCCLSIRTSPSAVVARLNPVRRLLIHAAYRGCETVVVQTDAAAAWVKASIGRDAVVIRNMLRPMADRGVPKEPLILAIGSLTPHKGHDVLFRAFAKVSRIHPEWRLVILGEGPRRDLLSRLSVDLGIDEKIEMPGHVQDVEQWLAKASIFAMTSWYEGYPNALIEAMAMELAVVSTDCPDGPKEIIEDSLNGFLIPVGDTEAAAFALRKLIASPELRENMGNQARRIREALDPEIIMHQWDSNVLGIESKTPADQLGQH